MKRREGVTDWGSSASQTGVCRSHRAARVTANGPLTHASTTPIRRPLDNVLPSL